MTARLEPHLALERTDFAQSIDIDGETTPVGIIARLEHALDRMDAELEEQRRRAIDAKARLAGYEPRLGETFPLQGELDDKLGPACRDRGGPRQHRGCRPTRPIRHSRRPSRPERPRPFGRSPALSIRPSIHDRNNR